MSVARTARRRRSQARLGKKGLAQVFGWKSAPKYPGVVSKEKASAKLRRTIENERKIGKR